MHIVLGKNLSQKRHITPLDRSDFAQLIAKSRLRGRKTASRKPWADPSKMMTPVLLATALYTKRFTANSRSNVQETAMSTFEKGLVNMLARAF